MEPDESGSLVARRSLAKVLNSVSVQQVGLLEHAELLDQPLVFSKYSGCPRVCPNSSWRSILADSFQRRLIVLALVYAGVGLSCYAMSNNVILYLSVRSGGIVGPNAPETLPDVVHEMLDPLDLKDTGPARLIADAIPYTCFPFGVCMLFVAGETRRIVNMAGVLLFLLLCNSVAGMVTIMPDAHEGGPQRCFAIKKFTGDNLRVMQKSGPWIMNVVQGAFACNDMMWSGHTMNTTFGMLILERVIKQRVQNGSLATVLRAMCYLIIFVYCFLLLSIKIHYTSDVFIGLLLAASFFHHAPFHEWVWQTSCFLVGLRKEHDLPADDKWNS